MKTYQVSYIIYEAIEAENEDEAIMILYDRIRESFPNTMIFPGKIMKLSKCESK